MVSMVQDTMNSIGHVYFIAFCQSGSCNTRAMPTWPPMVTNTATLAISHSQGQTPRFTSLFILSLHPLIPFLPIYPFLSPFIIAFPHTLFVLLHLTLFHISSIDTYHRPYAFQLRILQWNTNTDAVSHSVSTFRQRLGDSHHRIRIGSGRQLL